MPRANHAVTTTAGFPQAKSSPPLPFNERFWQSTSAMADNYSPELTRYKLDAIFSENTVTNDPSDRQPPPGMEEGRTVWRIGKVLGSGSFGIVSLQEDERSGQLRAVKVIHKSQSGAQELKTLVALRDVCSSHFYLLRTLQTAHTPATGS